MFYVVDVFDLWGLVLNFVCRIWKSELRIKLWVIMIMIVLDFWFVNNGIRWFWIKWVVFSFIFLCVLVLLWVVLNFLFFVDWKLCLCKLMSGIGFSFLMVLGILLLLVLYFCFWESWVLVIFMVVKMVFCRFDEKIWVIWWCFVMCFFRCCVCKMLWVVSGELWIFVLWIG